jgi:hypothetical protein
MVRGDMLRRWSYARPLTLYPNTNNPQQVTVPINAPPVEAILRTGSESVPAVSLAVLTPSEQRRMQTNFFHLRNIALQRTQKCPYQGCDRFFELSRQDQIREHLRDTHEAEKCNFCSEKLYRHWSPQQRRAHFLDRHADQFILDADRAMNHEFSVRSLNRVDHGREQRYHFCPRCGRDHYVLDAKGDRAHHDNVCYPDASDDLPGWVACQNCGGRIEGRRNDHKCRSRTDGGKSPFCPRCGVAKGNFTKVYREKHDVSCRGHGGAGIVANFCPWCGVALEAERAGALNHLGDCRRRPRDAEGPIDLTAGSPLPTAGPKKASRKTTNAPRKNVNGAITDKDTIDKNTRRTETKT